MPSAITAKRKDDAVLSVFQDNEKKKIIIEHANAAVEKLTGYPESALVGKELETLLPERERDMLRSYIEYDEGDSDLATVLRKMLSFHLINKQGETLLVGVKAFYGISEDAQKIQFELLLRDISLLSEIEQLRESLVKEYTDGEQLVNPKTGLIDDTVFMKDVNVIADAVTRLGIEACVAVFKVDNLLNHSNGEEVICNHLVGATGRLIKESCRDEDIVGHVSVSSNADPSHAHYIGVVLFDCTSQAAQVVFNRVRMLRHSQPVIYEDTQYDVTVSSAYALIRPQVDVSEVVNSCIYKLQENAAVGGNRIYEV